MDAAARELKMDPAALRRRNMIRPEQMPYTQRDGPDLRQRPFEKIMDQGLALADWNGFAARREESKQRGKLRGRGIATFLEWTSGMRLRGEGLDRRHARRLHRDLLGDAADGPGHPDQLRAARGRRVRRADREGAHRPGRHRPRQRLRQRRLALALHRRLGGEGRRRAHDRHGQGPRRRGARGRRRRHRVPRRPLLGGRHRSRHRPVRAGRQAGRGAHPRRRDGDRGRADLAERLPRLRGRDRSATAATCRSSPTRRSTTSAGS